ncbi:hypothetical protein ABIE13_000280 [Ottowia thiooxydans]|uniref:Uncharacterized protein n=1 Tax=Ottowia thiooxydans TaxID=219182 RepID=A0ABV2Q2C6_9BURK
MVRANGKAACQLLAGPAKQSTQEDAELTLLRHAVSTVTVLPEPEYAPRHCAQAPPGCTHLPGN